MKLENWEAICKKMDKLHAIKHAIKKINGGITSENPPYGLYISEHSDKSGYCIDLSGLGLNNAIMIAALNELKQLEEKISKELEDL